MEIERKFLVPCLPEGYDTHPFHQIEQAYLCTEPVVRIRQEDDSFYLTYKGKGLLSRRNTTSPDPGSLRPPAPQGRRRGTHQKRYLIPLDGSDHLTIELDVFEGRYAGLILAEVEFTSEEEAMAFQAPEWFGRDVTFTREYQNSRLACGK